ncbi:MAG: transporter substrate-binding domain-containing protein [Pseudolabrys sp.]|jgi:polar amino acid transport system substrate-binding protein
MQPTIFAAISVGLSLTFAQLASAVAEGQKVSDPRIADLVRAGKVRVALYLPQYTKDPVSGELRGWPIDLVRALGERLGIEGVPVEHPTPPQAIACLKSGNCDVAILGIDPTRATEVDYSSPFAQLEYTFLVPDGSSINSLADADRPGVRIAVVRNHASTLALTRILKQASPVYTEMIDPAFDLLRTKQVDAFASVRGELVKYSTQLPGSRVLEASYGANRFGMAVSKGQAAERLAYMSEFIDEARASGLLQRAIDRSGLRGLSVVPSAKTN